MEFNWKWNFLQKVTASVGYGYYANTDGDNANKYLELMNQDVDSITFEFDAEDFSTFGIDQYEFCYSFCKYLCRVQSD